MKCFLGKEGQLQFQNLDPSLVKVLLDSLLTKNWKTHFLTTNCSSTLQQKSPEFFSDWKKYIEPEVSSLLGECYTVMLSDFNKLKKEDHDNETEVTLTIPLDHYEAWLRMLSVARLALANSLEEKKCTELLFRQDFLTVLQQYLVEAEETREN
ncbi:MAG: hypothetical protein K2W99_05460 [Chthoniobacterales bacterium]|nr:hypothetical protein [Chthoniobacterales bacterium]